MPSFPNACFQTVAYQFNSFVLRVSDAPTSGHCVTFVLVLTSDVLMFQCVSSGLRADEMAWSHRDAYVFLYCRIDGRARIWEYSALGPRAENALLI